MEEAAAAVTAWGQAHGMLPDGVELVPMDLQADAQWIAPAPWTQKPNGGVAWTEVRMDTRPAAYVVEGELFAQALKASGRLDNFMAAVRSACESVLELSRTLRQEPRPHGSNEPCSCHPKPFPAARDYRRRTKHRNRRRKS